MGVIITKDNGDYFILTENIEGAKVEFFKKNEATQLFDLEISLNFDNFEEAIKAVDSFDIIKDLVL